MVHFHKYPSAQSLFRTNFHGHHDPLSHPSIATDCGNQEFWFFAQYAPTPIQLEKNTYRLCRALKFSFF
jgi:hypothetical protein